MQNLIFVEFIGVPVIYLGGALLHFLYKYGGRKAILAIISPVNESIWEHLKIAFYPACAYSLFQFFTSSYNQANFFTAELIGIYCMMLFILIVEIIYPAMLKRNILILDLIVFFIAIVISQWVSYMFHTTFQAVTVSNPVVAIIVFVQISVFTCLSFFPPKLPLFRDAVDGKYGIKG